MHENIWSAVLHQPAAFQDKDAVKTANGRQSMRNGDDRPALHEAVEGIADQLF